jgi:hypothetical protein
VIRDTFDAYVQARLQDAAARGARNALNFEHLLAPELARLGTHTFRPFSTEVRRDGIERDFIATVAAIADRAGLPPPPPFGDMERPARVNETDGPALIEAGRTIAVRLEGAFGDSGRFPRLNGTIHALLLEAAARLGIAKGRYAGLTPERYARIRDQFRPGNDRFARATWGRPWDEVFPTADPGSLVSNDVNDTGDPGVAQEAATLVAEVTPRVDAEIAQFARRHRQADGSKGRTRSRETD